MKPTVVRRVPALVLAAGLLAAAAPLQAQVQVQMQPASRAPAATPNTATTLAPQIQLQVQMPGGDTGATGSAAPGPRSRQGSGYGQQPVYGQQGAQPGPPPCPDSGSFVVVGPQAGRGQPIVAQAWNDCADLPGSGAQQPQIGIDIQISPQQDTQGQTNQQGSGSARTGAGGTGFVAGGFAAGATRQGSGILLVRPGRSPR